MKEVIIYTDGACSGNPGPGAGPPSLLIMTPKRKYPDEKIYNQPENGAQGGGGSLKCLKEPCKVKLYSDSAYLINAFKQGWLDKWQRNGWKTVNNEPVENQDLWKELLKLNRRHTIQWNKVKGHDSDPRNNRCDFLARQAVPSIL